MTKATSLHELVSLFLLGDPQRGELLSAHVASAPRCAIGRYLLGCVCLDERLPAQATRHFMVAYHADSRLESAALLTFAGLNWSAEPDRPLLDVVLDTRREYSRLAFDRTVLERRLLNSVAPVDPQPAGASAPPSALWRLPVRLLRVALRPGQESVAPAGAA